MRAQSLIRLHLSTPEEPDPSAGTPYGAVVAGAEPSGDRIMRAAVKEEIATLAATDAAAKEAKLGQVRAAAEQAEATARTMKTMADGGYG